MKIVAPESQSPLGILSEGARQIAEDLFRSPNDGYSPLDKRDQWTEPEDLAHINNEGFMKPAKKILQQLVFISLCVLHCGLIACTLCEIWRIWSFYPADPYDGQNMVFAVSLMMMDVMIAGIMMIFLAVIGMTGGRKGIQNSISWVSLIAQGFQALAYNAMSFAAIVLLAKRFRIQLRDVRIADRDKIMGIVVNFGHVVHHDLHMTTIGMYTILSILGLYYLSYSLATVAGIARWLYEATWQSRMMVVNEFFGNQQHTAYVYNTGQDLYVQSLVRMHHWYDSSQRPITNNAYVSLNSDKKSLRRFASTPAESSASRLELHEEFEEAVDFSNK